MWVKRKRRIGRRGRETGTQTGGETVSYPPVYPSQVCKIPKSTSFGIGALLQGRMIFALNTGINLLMSHILNGALVNLQNEAWGREISMRGSGPGSMKGLDKG